MLPTMKPRFFLLALAFCAQAQAFEILALGTSGTNCAGVARDKIYPVRLQELLRAQGVDATVLNGGEDGDTPVFMIRRMAKLLTPQTRLVILEPGPNDPNRDSAREYAEKMLAELKARNLPTIYISNGQLQSLEDARELAAKYGASFYGFYGKGIPFDRDHYQFDFQRGGKGRGGHLTAEGCALLAQGLEPLVKQVIEQKAIH
jgi:lysophospholipase L1-like esterase